MERVVPKPAKVEIGFTDDRLTGTGGAALLAEVARRFGLAERLADAVSVKRRNRGASDAETQWSVIASLAAGNGSLSDLDALRGDGVQRELLGLSSAPSGRRAGEFLSRLTKWDVERLHGVSASGAVPSGGGTPVWVRCDAARHRREFVEFVLGKGWDVSISVTDPNKSRPIPDVVEGLPERCWEDIGNGKSAKPLCPSILDTNILVSATASQRQPHLATRDVVRWPTLGRQTHVSGQIVWRASSPVDGALHRQRRAFSRGAPWVQGPSWSISSSRASAALAVASAERVTASASVSPTAATTPILRSPASTGAPTGGGPPTVR